MVDRDGDGFIDWPEFVKTVISKEASFSERESSHDAMMQHPANLEPELEYSLCRVFEEELDGILKLEKYKLQLSIHPDLGLIQSFKLLDPFGKGYFDQIDLQEFISAHFYPVSQYRAERIFRRLDLDYDGRVGYQEWNHVARPREINDTMMLDMQRNADWVRDQEVDRKYEKVMSPEKFEKTFYDDLDIHASKIAISPTKEYVRVPVGADSRDFTLRPNTTEFSSTLREPALTKPSHTFESTTRIDTDGFPEHKRLKITHE